MTLKEHNDDISTNNTKRKQQKTEPRWMIQLHQKINSLRRNIAHIELILKCKGTNTFSQNQLKIQNRLRKKYGNVRKNTLIFRQKTLKNELKATSTKMAYDKKVFERKTNKQTICTKSKSCISFISRKQK